MNTETLQGLQQLNQVRLTEQETADALAFFEARDAELAQLNQVDTENVQRLVWVNPMENVLRADEAQKIFTREQLQAQAPEVMDDYWQVPRVAN